MQLRDRRGPGPQNTPPGVLAGREAGGALSGDLGRCRASWAWEPVRVGVLTQTSPVWGLQDHPRDGQRHPEHSRPRGAAGAEWGVWGGDSDPASEEWEGDLSTPLCCQLDCISAAWLGRNQVILSTRRPVLPTGKTGNQNNGPSCYHLVHRKVTRTPSLGATLGKKTSHSHGGKMSVRLLRESWPPHESREGNSLPPSPTSFQIQDPLEPNSSEIAATLGFYFSAVSALCFVRGYHLDKQKDQKERSFKGNRGSGPSAEITCVV